MQVTKLTVSDFMVHFKMFLGGITGDPWIFIF